MDLAEVPIALILAGLTAYVVLGGADFGAGVWYMALPGERHRRLRDHTYHAMGPVWEANHVWLIFVFVIAWTVYPRAFGAIMSTLYVPFFIAAVGIILRGTMYALRGWATRSREEQLVGAIFGVSSVLTPFALGAAIGGIASDRVPADGAGDAVTSWLNATSITTGAIAVLTAAYLAATWLAADAARAGDDELVRAFRVRALACGVVAGAVAVAGLLVIRADARELFDELTSSPAVFAVIASGLAGAATLAFVYARRLELARFGAAAAVAAIVVGWALAQRPDVLPGLTAVEAAAGDAVVVAVLVSTALGALILVPSLGLLFSMVLRGRFDEQPEEPGSMREAATGDVPLGAPERLPPSRPLAAAAGASAAAGVPLMLVFDDGIVLALGVVLLLAAVVLVCAATLPAATAGER